MNAMKQNEEKLLDHDYDGIQELDNPLPKWWINLFYITVVFGIIYFIYYTLGYGDSIAEKHEKKLKALTQSGQTEEVISFDKVSADLQKGRELYEAKCAACHKADGGGLVGPNLTDNYWIHGKGNNEDIYKVISKGVPQKGMIAWDALLKPEEIRDVTVYVQSLRGTNPQNAKPAEGELYE